jgi:hypothetical protein
MTDPFAPPPPGEQPPTNPYGAPPPPPYGAPPPPPYGAPAPYGAPLPYGTPSPRVRNGFGVASLVLGIASLLCLFLFVVPAVMAVVFGFLGRARAKRGEATNGGLALAGIITGGIGLVAAAACYAFVFANFDAFRTFNDCQTAANGDTVAEQACSDQLAHDLFGTTASG